MIFQEIFINFGFRDPDIRLEKLDKMRGPSAINNAVPPFVGTTNGSDDWFAVAWGGRGTSLSKSCLDRGRGIHRRCIPSDNRFGIEAGARIAASRKKLE